MRWLAVVVLVLAASRVEAHPPVDRPCDGCHEDVHRGELARECGGCHGLERWVPSTFGAARHATFPLEGRHRATPCGGCHGARPRVSFVVAGKDCLDCHTNPHGTRFAEQQVKRGCAGCHTAGNWKAWRVEHGTWPLGVHEQVACAKCHAGRDAQSPVAEFRGVARECAQCHADPHGGQFRSCGACHQESFRAPFDHARARLKLEGKHQDVACGTCHPVTELRNGERVTRWRLGYAACRDCHANPHPRVAADCVGCHGVTGWRLEGSAGAGFDHATTGFALAGAHRGAACARCHQNRPRPPAACESCHRDGHLGRVEGPCAECHTATAWSDVAMLERHRRTRMPLTGRHAQVECTACHKRGAEKGAPTDCFACHRGGYGRAMPDHDGAVPFSRDCTGCHTTIAWTPARAAGVARSHDAFQISSGPHRVAECAACHADPRRMRLVRCDGCHGGEALRRTHRAPVSAAAAACLGCHPRGVRR